MAPDLLLVEAGNALRRKLKGGEISIVQAKAGLAFISNSVKLRRVGLTVVGRAMEIAHVMGHPIYDCIYVALAEKRQAPLVTNDAELIQRMRRSGFGGLIFGMVRFWTLQ